MQSVPQPSEFLPKFFLTYAVLPSDAEFLLIETMLYTVKLGNKERFDKEQIGIKEPFPVTNLPFTS